MCDVCLYWWWLVVGGYWLLVCGWWLVAGGWWFVVVVVVVVVCVSYSGANLIGGCFNIFMLETFMLGSEWCSVSVMIAEDVFL